METVVRRGFSKQEQLVLNNSCATIFTTASKTVMIKSVVTSKTAVLN